MDFKDSKFGGFKIFFTQLYKSKSLLIKGKLGHKLASLKTFKGLSVLTLIIIKHLTRKSYLNFKCFRF